MRKSVILSMLLFACIFSIQNASAQYRRGGLQDFFDQTSLEIGAGWHTTIMPTKNTSNSEFAGFNSFYGGMHYALNEMWGVRGTYAYHNFEHKKIAGRGLTQHKLMLEMTYSLGSAFSGNYRYTDFNDFDVLAHAGFGASLIKDEVYSGSDWIKNIQLGLMPTYKLGDRVKIHLDLIYIINAGQNYTFSGIYNTGTTEAFFTANFGLLIALGR